MKNCSRAASVMLYAETRWTMAADRDRWVWRTALGIPVVPELKGSTDSSRERSTSRSGGRLPGDPAARSQNDPQPAGRSSSTQMHRSMPACPCRLDDLGQWPIGHDSHRPGDEIGRGVV